MANLSFAAELPHLLSNVKVLWGVATGIVLLIADKNIGPSQQDLPTSLKSILAVLCAAEVTLLLNLDISLSQKYLIAAGTAVLLLAALYTYFSFATTYTKEIDGPAPWWRFWNRNNVTEITKVVGGLLNQRSRSRLNLSPDVSVQTYFEGVGYDEDLVWSRWSRGINQIVIFLLYSAFILAAAACLVIPARDLVESAPKRVDEDSGIIKQLRGEIESFLGKIQLGVSRGEMQAEIEAQIRKIGTVGPEYLGQLAGFESGNSELTGDMEKTVSTICERWHKRDEGRDGFLLMVGTADRVRLGASARLRYESNLGLARARAESVKSKTVDCGVPAARILALGSGPRIALERVAPPAADVGSAEDRTVDVWVFWSLR